MFGVELYDIIWTISLGTMAVVGVDEGFLQYKETTFVYIGCCGSPRFRGLYSRDEKIHLAFVSVEADRSPRFHSHLGGSHSSNHFCVIAYLRSHFLSCT